MTMFRNFAYAAAVAATAAVAGLPFGAMAAKTSVNIAMTLEPPGLDPRANPAAAIGQIADAMAIAQGDNAAVLDGQGLGPGMGSLHGANVGVDNNGIDGGH